jgi:hypothetical protein
MFIRRRVKSHFSIKAPQLTTLLISVSGTLSGYGLTMPAERRSENMVRGHPVDYTRATLRIPFPSYPLDASLSGKSVLPKSV